MLKQFFKDLKIRSKIFLVFCSFIIIFLFLIPINIFILKYFARQKLFFEMQETKRDFDLLTNIHTQRLNTFNINVIQSEEIKNFFFRRDKDKLFQRIDDLLKNFRNNSIPYNIIFYNPDGTIFLTDSDNKKNYDFQSSSILKKTMQSSKIVSGFEPSPNCLLRLKSIMPIFNQNQIAGYIESSIPLNSILSNFTDKNIIVILSEQYFKKQNCNFSKNYDVIDNYIKAFSSIKDNAHLIIKEFIENNKYLNVPDNMVVFNDKQKNRKIYISGFHILDFNKSAVGIFLTGLDENDIFVIRAVESINIILTALIIFMFVLSIFISDIFSKIIAKPIVNFMNLAKAVSNGNFEERVKVSSKDELGELGLVFNKMAENLQSTYNELNCTNEELEVTNEELIIAQDELNLLNAHLEKKIDERTAELNQANEELSQANEELSQTNEELSQTTEELQIINEELRCANEKLSNKNKVIKEQEEYFRGLIEYSYEITMAIDENKIIKYVSPSIEKITNYKIDDIFMKNLFEFIHTDDIEYLKNQFIDIIQNPDKILIFEIRFLNQSNGYLTFECTTRNLLNNPLINAIIINARDISERKKYEDQLLKSERLAAVGQLAAGISHEFNNILTIINGNIQLIIKYTELAHNFDKKYINRLNIIEKQINRGIDIVSKILSFSKPQPLQYEPVEISKIINEIIELQKSQMELENIDISTEYNHKSKLNVDKGQIEQVLFNLIINARHSILPKRKGSIKITTAEENEIMNISISDTGIGMDDETKSKIFTPFFTTKGALSKDDYKLKGTGLGLAISYTIIKNHNGSITVKTSKNTGATFIIKLPIFNFKQYEIGQQDKIDIPEKLSEDTVKNKNVRILIVDDEKDITDFMVEVFSTFGYGNCVVVNSSENVMQILNQEQIDIVFLDLLMPNISGDAIFNYIKQVKPDVPVIFISGQSKIEVSQTIVTGAFDYLRKPFGINDLINILDKTISKSSMDKRVV